MIVFFLPILVILECAKYSYPAALGLPPGAASLCPYAAHSCFPCVWMAVFMV